MRDLFKQFFDMIWNLIALVIVAAIVLILLATK